MAKPPLSIDLPPSACTHTLAFLIFYDKPSHRHQKALSTSRNPRSVFKVLEYLSAFISPRLAHSASHRPAMGVKLPHQHHREPPCCQSHGASVLSSLHLMSWLQIILKACKRLPSEVTVLMAAEGLGVGVWGDRHDFSKAQQ